jgi:hypothetical protein
MSGHAAPWHEPENWPSDDAFPEGAPYAEDAHAVPYIERGMLLAKAHRIEALTSEANTFDEIGGSSYMRLNYSEFETSQDKSWFSAHRLSI